MGGTLLSLFLSRRQGEAAGRRIRILHHAHSSRHSILIRKDMVVCLAGRGSEPVRNRPPRERLTSFSYAGTVILDVCISQHAMCPYIDRSHDELDGRAWQMRSRFFTGRYLVEASAKFVPHGSR